MRNTHWFQNIVLSHSLR